jgi:hypothetical protein
MNQLSEQPVGEARPLLLAPSGPGEKEAKLRAGSISDHGDWAGLETSSGG